MSTSSRQQAQERTQKRMSTPMSEGGTKGSFKAAASKAGYETSPAELKSFAKKVLDDPKASPKLKKKANFYINVISK